MFVYKPFPRQSRSRLRTLTLCSHRLHFPWQDWTPWWCDYQSQGQGFFSKWDSRELKFKLCLSLWTWQVAGLCGSDLHQYRYHDRFPNPCVIWYRLGLLYGASYLYTFSRFVAGHEFAGEVVDLGSSYGPNANASGRPSLYTSLKIGDKVVSPFTSSCCECQCVHISSVAFISLICVSFCRVGFTSRCESSLLFGSQVLPGGQAQYVRVPKAGGTLFKIPPDRATTSQQRAQWNSISDASLLLLADILPTGFFAVTQALHHPNILPILNAKPFPASSFAQGSTNEQSLMTLLTDGLPPLTNSDMILTVAVIGLGPVGLVSIHTLLFAIQPLNCVCLISFTRGSLLVRDNQPPWSIGCQRMPRDTYCSNWSNPEQTNQSLQGRRKTWRCSRQWYIQSRHHRRRKEDYCRLDRWPWMQHSPRGQQYNHRLIVDC